MQYLERIKVEGSDRPRVLLFLGNHRLLPRRQDVGHIVQSKHAIVPATCNNPGAFQKPIAKAPPDQLVKPA